MQSYEGYITPQKSIVDYQKNINTTVYNDNKFNLVNSGMLGSGSNNTQNYSNSNHNISHIIPSEKKQYNNIDC